MNGDSRMEVDEEDGAETEGEMETRYAPLIIDGKITHSVSQFCKLGKRVGENHSKKQRVDLKDIHYSSWTQIDRMKYQISVGVTVNEEEEKFLSFFFTAIPADKLDDWYCFVDAELRLVHPCKRDVIQFSGAVVLTTKRKFGWDNFATWDEVQPYINKEDKDKIQVEVIIRNQMLFTVCDSVTSMTEPIPTRKQMDHFIRPLFNSGTFADVFFQVDDDDQIPAHRLVLASKSGVFQKLLYEKKPFDRVIDLKKEGFGDIQKAALLSILKFYYKTELVINDKILADVYYAAKKFKIDIVQETCKLFVTQANAITVLTKAVDLKLNKLTAECWSRIREDVTDFVKSDQFRTCEPDQLKKLIVSDNLSAPEYLIFKSCRAWAQNRCKKRGIDAPTPAQLREQLGDHLNLIRFPLIRAEKLELILKDYGGLFTPEETVQLTAFMKGKEVRGHFLFPRLKRKAAD